MNVIRFDPIRRDTDWIVPLKFRDADTGAPFDLTGASATLTLWGPDRCSLMTGSNASGEISYPETGVMLLEFFAPRLSCYRCGTYPVDIILKRDGFTWCALTALLPII